MIIECGNCRTAFNLDENLLFDKGSKVRCSICRHVFLAYPPSSPSHPEDELEQTASLDSSPQVEGKSEEQDADGELDFGEIIDEQPFEEDITVSVPVTEDLGDFGEEESSDEPDVEEVAEEGQAEEGTLSDSTVLGDLPFGKKKSGKSRMLLVVIILLLFLAGGAAGVIRYAPQFLPDFLTSLKPKGKPPVADPGIRRLSFKAVTGSFVNAKKAGRLFVIKGIVTNNYSKSRKLVLIEGTVLDDKGVIVKKKVAYGGNVLSDEKLNQLSLEEINEALKTGEHSKMAPEESIPFMIVFEGLPKNLSEFTVEAISSKPVG